MTQADFEWPNQLAPGDSFHGQLQRGRGIAYLSALEMPREELRPLLLDCITRDARHDAQTESRGDYYAEIARLTAFDAGLVMAHVRRWDAEAEYNCRLALETLGALARRGDEGAIAFLREYLGWGASWVDPLENLLGFGSVSACADLAEVLCARFDDDALVGELARVDHQVELLDAWSATSQRIALAVQRVRAVEDTRERSAQFAEARARELSVEEALFLLGGRRGRFGDDTWNLTCAVEDRASVDDIELLRDALHPHRPARYRAAMKALARLATPLAHEAILVGVQRLGELRTASIRPTELALLSLPPDRTLPLAREWLQRTSYPYQIVALELLARHATEDDVPRLLERLTPTDADELHFDAHDTLVALRRFPGRGWLPGVEHAFVTLRCANCRTKAAHALAVLDRERFACTYAHECLWDCNEETILLGIAHAPLDAPLVRARLEELSRMPAWFDADVRAKAAARLATER